MVRSGLDNGWEFLSTPLPSPAGDIDATKDKLRRNNLKWS